MTALQRTGKFGIEVNFLTGRYVATHHNNRRQAEWPPHTARLFSALVSTYAEAGSSSLERVALEWLESQSPPAIAASEATLRSIVSHFVPVPDVSIIGASTYMKRAEKVIDIQKQLDRDLALDKNRNISNITRLQKKLSKAQDVETLVNGVGKTNPSTALSMFPEKRNRQERFFPSVTPHTPRVTYIWDNEPSSELAKSLDNILERVVRLGHSSSLVSCRITYNTPSADYIPSIGGENIRSVRKGQLAALEKMYCAHKEVKPRSLPYADIRYNVPKDTKDSASIKSNMVGEWLVFEFAHNSRAFPSTRAVEVAQAMRSAIMSHVSDPIPEGISGHQPNGAPTTMPHVAFFAPTIRWL